MFGEAPIGGVAEGAQESLDDARGMVDGAVVGVVGGTALGAGDGAEAVFVGDLAGLLAASVVDLRAL